MILRKTLALALAALFIAAAIFSPRTALAQGSAGGGVLTESGNGQSSTGGALFIGTGAAIPVVPVEVGVTGLVPLITGGGYAVTVEGRFAFAGNALGVGYGIGRFGNAPAGGTLTAFLDHRVAPLTSVELRLYRTTGAQGTTAGFLGLRFSL
jgi:hypothetical protein